VFLKIFCNFVKKKIEMKNILIMKKYFAAVLFTGIAIGFAIHGLAVQFMNDMIVWKIIAHSVLFVLGCIFVVLVFKRMNNG